MSCLVEILKKLVNLLFPPKCVFCGRLLGINPKIEICDCCYADIPFYRREITEPAVNGSQESGCDSVICVCAYSGIVKDSLIRYKFYNKPSYYRAFAVLLAGRIKKMTNFMEFDIIISVPLHKTRELARGYNQSLLISKALSRELGVPEGSGALLRVKKTGTQSLLGKNQRAVNVRGAFKVSSADTVRDKKILLVDDIMTTGSTIDECGKVLKKAGAKSVTAAVIASGRKI